MKELTQTIESTLQNYSFESLIAVGVAFVLGILFKKIVDNITNSILLQFSRFKVLGDATIDYGRKHCFYNDENELTVPFTVELPAYNKSDVDRVIYSPRIAFELSYLKRMEYDTVPRWHSIQYYITLPNDIITIPKRSHKNIEVSGELIFIGNNAQENVENVAYLVMGSFKNISLRFENANKITSTKVMRIKLVKHNVYICFDNSRAT